MVLSSKQKKRHQNSNCLKDKKKYFNLIEKKLIYLKPIYYGASTILQLKRKKRQFIVRLAKNIVHSCSLWFSTVCSALSFTLWQVCLQLPRWQQDGFQQQGRCFPCSCSETCDEWPWAKECRQPFLGLKLGVQMSQEGHDWLPESSSPHWYGKWGYLPLSHVGCMEKACRAWRVCLGGWVDAG